MHEGHLLQVQISKLHEFVVSSVKLFFVAICFNRVTHIYFKSDQSDSQKTGKFDFKRRQLIVPSANSKVIKLI